MRLNTALLRWGLRRLVAGRSPNILDTATRSWEIHPAETVRCPPAIHLPRALDRVTGLSPWRTWETERTFVDGGSITHAATRAHLIENVDLSGAFLYRGAAKAQPGFGTQQMLRRDDGPRQHLEEAHLASTWAGSRFFGNFLGGNLPLELLPDADAQAIAVETKPYEHEAGYREVLSLPRPPRLTAARIDRLTLYTDFGQNASKAARYADLRQRLRHTFSGAAPTGHAGVYLKRGTTGERRLIANEAALEAALTGLGFDIVEPAVLDAREVARRILDAPIVVSVEGSHLAHAIYAIAENGVFLVLQPPDRFAMDFKEFTDCADLRFAFIVGHPMPDGFTVDIEDLKRTLDLL